MKAPLQPRARLLCPSDRLTPSGVAYLGPALSCLLMAAAPLSLLQPYVRSRAGFPLDFHYIQAALGLTASLLIIQPWIIHIEEARSTKRTWLALNTLTFILLVHFSSTVIQLWKAVTHRVPETFTEQGIYLSAIHAGGIASLYSATNATTAPFLTTLYPPVYYILTRTFFDIFGRSISVLRAESVVAVFAISLLVAAAIFGCSVK